MQKIIPRANIGAKIWRAHRVSFLFFGFSIAMGDWFCWGFWKSKLKGTCPFCEDGTKYPCWYW